jgi:hypothetical protein
MTKLSGEKILITIPQTVRCRRRLFVFCVIAGFMLNGGISRAQDCRDSLLGNSYACTLKFQLVTTTTGSDRVVLNNVRLSGVISFSDFTEDDNPGNAFVSTLGVGNDSRTTYCSCKSQGGFTRPKLGASPDEFVCLAADDEGKGLMFEGQVTARGNTLTQGEVWFVDPSFEPVAGNGEFRRGVFACDRLRVPNAPSVK